MHNLHIESLPLLQGPNSCVDIVATALVQDINQVDRILELVKNPEIVSCFLLTPQSSEIPSHFTNTLKYSKPISSEVAIERMKMHALAH